VTPRSRTLSLVAVTVAALAARWIVLASFDGHPLLRPEGGLDTDVYINLARRVAGGDLFLRSVPEPFFVSPLYVYFAALVLALSGGSLFAVAAVQVLLGAAAVWLTGDTARRVFGDDAALPAAILLALTGVVAFHEAVPLQAALDPFLAALTLWLLARALESGRFRAVLMAGLSLGVFALNRPNVLPWAGVAALLLVSRGLREWGRSAAALVLGTAIGILPATARNLAVSGEPVVVSSHGGLNFLVGNGPGANGVYRWMDGITPNIAGQAADAKRVAEKEAGSTLSTGEVSAHFAAKAWSWIRSEPGAACRLFVRKVWYVLSGDETPLNFSYPWYRRESTTLKLLAVGPWLLVPLGGAGLALGFAGATRLRWREFAVWASFAPVYVLLVAAFFVATRYRLPLYVPLAMTSGGAAALLVSELRARNFRRLLLAAAVAVPLTAVTLWPTGLYDGAADEETLWVLHLIDTGAAGEAATRSAALAKVHPQPGVMWFRVGQAWVGAGGLDEAIAALERSRAVDPGQAEPTKVLAAVREKRGIERSIAADAAGALADLEAAVGLDPSAPAARLNLAAVLAEQGEIARARALAREALALQPGYEKAEALLRALDGRR
jgi:4-amino-4-deoxy-L-arabinose transferase-like glycosyltransferase